MKRRKSLILARLYKDGAKHIGWMLLTLFLLLAEAPVSVAISFTYGDLTDKLFVLSSWKQMIQIIVILVTLIIINSIRNWANYISNANMSEKIFLDLRRRIFDHLGKVRLHDMMQAGDISTRINNDVIQLCEIVVSKFGWYIRVAFTGLISAIACFFISWKLTLCYLILVPLSIGLQKRVGSKIKQRQKNNLEYLSQAANLAHEIIRGNSVIRTFGAEGKMDKFFEKKVDHAVAEAIESEKLSAWIAAIRYLTDIIPLGILFGVSTMLVYRGDLTVGSFIAFFTMSSYIREAFGLSDSVITNIHKGIVYAERIYELIDMPEEESGEFSSEEGSEEAILFKDVAFGYNNSSLVLRNVNISVKSGDKVAILGESGCGKSTLASLACGFEKPSKGTLRIMGIEMEQWSKQALWKNIALIPQTPFLLNDTIYHNLKLDDQKNSNKEIKAALQKVEMWEFVHSQPEGLDFIVGENGSKLSGGQKQRICIARALLKQAPIILLDEPMASVDYKLERKIEQVLYEEFRDRTVIMITHREIHKSWYQQIIRISNGCVLMDAPKK